MQDATLPTEPITPTLDSPTGKALVVAVASSAEYVSGSDGTGWLFRPRTAADGCKDDAARAILRDAPNTPPAPADYHMRRDAGPRRLRAAARNWLVYEGLVRS